MTQLSCKHDMKSKSHAGMKLAPVRAFSFKLTPLQAYSLYFWQAEIAVELAVFLAKQNWFSKTR